VQPGSIIEVTIARIREILGSDIVTSPDALLDTIAEGGSGYHFFGKSAEKTNVCRSVP